MQRKTILTLLGVALAVPILYFAYYIISPFFINVVVDEAAPVTSNEFETSARTNIVDTPGHPASGTVQVLTDATQTIVRYEDFKTINGPDLFVYLATDLEATEFVNLGDLKATEGNVNYTVPADVSVEDYKYVLVWCKQFGVLFNYAPLTLE